MNPIDTVAEAIREQAHELARQAVTIVRREEPQVEGVVLHDERTDTLRETRIWHVTDPETGEECVLRLRVARGVIRAIDDAEWPEPVDEDLDIVLDTEGGPVL